MLILDICDKMSLPNIHVIDNNELLSEKIGYHLEELILQLMNKKQLITIGLSGGSLVDLLASIIPRLQLPWARLRLFFVDERFVPFTSDESTFANYQKKLFRQLPLTEKNIIKIDPTLPSVEQAAQEYQTKLNDLLTEDQVNFMIIVQIFQFIFRLLIFFYLEWVLMDTQQVFFPIMLL